MNSADLNKAIKGLLGKWLHNQEALYLFAKEVQLPMGYIQDWLTGDHDFSIHQIGMIEEYFKVKLIQPLVVESSIAAIAIHKERIEIGLRAMTTRGRNAMDKLYDDCGDIPAFLKALEDIRGNPGILPNVGKRTIVDIMEFIEFIAQGGTAKEKDLSDLEAIRLSRQLIDKLGLSIHDSQEVADKILHQQPFFFRLLYTIVRTTAFIRNPVREVILDEMTMALASNPDQQDLAEKLNLLPERVRQWRKRLPGELGKIIRRILTVIELRSVEEIYPDIFQHQEVIVEPVLAQKINDVENIHLSVRAIGFAIGHLKGNRFTSIEFDSGMIYIVPLAWVEYFDLYAFYDLLQKSLAFRRRLAEQTSLQRLVEKFVKKKNPLFEAELLHFLPKLVKHEFDLDLDADGKIIFPRNAKKTLVDFVQEAIEKADQPIALDDVVNYVNQLPGNKNWKKAIVHSALMRNKEILTFSKSGTYGLKKWESERSNIRGGSITELIYQFVEQQEKQVHVSQIEYFIQQFRQTNVKNISALMMLDRKKRFVRLARGYYGLKDRVYS